MKARVARIVLAALLAPGCGAVLAPSRRAEIVASRHVLVVRPVADNPQSVADDGSPLANGKLDVVWCARICSGVVASGERIVGCFTTVSVADDISRRLRTNGELVDCALGPTSRQ